jgi:uncharacterized protein
MAIALAAIPEGSFATRAFVLGVVAVGITAAVYGGVALIVKADDAGVALARNTSTSALGKLSRAFGKGVVMGMPVLLVVLSIVGTAAMIWVGGGIIVHGLEEFRWPWAGHVIHTAAEAAGRAMPAITGAVEWIVTAAGSGVVGLVVGGALIPIVGYMIAPAWKAVRRLLAKTQA